MLLDVDLGAKETLSACIHHTIQQQDINRKHIKAGPDLENIKTK